MSGPLVGAKIQIGDTVEFTWQHLGATTTIVGVLASIVENDFIERFGGLDGPMTSFTTYVLGDGYEVRVKPDTSWSCRVLEKAKPVLPTTPGSIVTWPSTGGGHHRGILADDGRWYVQTHGWQPDALGKRHWKLVKDAGAS